MLSSPPSYVLSQCWSQEHFITNSSCTKISDPQSASWGTWPGTHVHHSPKVSCPFTPISLSSLWIPPPPQEAHLLLPLWMEWRPTSLGSRIFCSDETLTYRLLCPFSSYSVDCVCPTLVTLTFFSRILNEELFWLDGPIAWHWWLHPPSTAHLPGLPWH